MRRELALSGSCDSMAGTSDGCRFYTRSPAVGGNALLPIFGTVVRTVFGTEYVGGIEFVQMRLEPLLHVVRHPGKLNSHAHSRVAGAYDTAGRNVLLPNPEIYSKRGAGGQRHDRLNITAISADVGGVHPQGRIHPFIAQLERKRNLVAIEFAAVVMLLGSAFLGLHVNWQSLGPGTLLVGYQLHSHLHLLQRARVHHPDHPAARLLALVLHPDDIAYLQFRLNPIKAGARGTDVLRHGGLKEGLAARVHSPHLHLQVDGGTRS